MDLAEIIRRAGVPSTAPVKAPEERKKYTDAGQCTCGHPFAAHDDETGVCSILECDCLDYIGTGPEKPKQVLCSVCGKPGRDEAMMVSRSGDMYHQACEPKVVHVPPEPTKKKEALAPEVCQHLCKCGNWWSHGPLEKCRYPGQLNYGMCQTCLSQGPATKDQNAYVAARNDERLIPHDLKVTVGCQGLTLDQLMEHIKHYDLVIQELRARQMEAKTVQAELEEEELKNIPPEEREKFIQAKRQGRKPKKEKEKKVEESEGVRLSKKEKYIQSLMKTMKKSHEEIERWLEE